MRTNRSQIYDARINIAAYVTGKLAEELGITKEKALLKIMRTNTYEMLQDDDIELYLYKKVYGCHFTEWLLEKALKNMRNEDSTMGGHWKVADTTMVARNNGITFDHFNEYDWNYVMNMIYSDYYGSVPNETSVYMKMARKFLEDRDAEEGKALRYYLAMKD